MSKSTILLILEDRDERSSLEKALIAEGYLIHAVENGVSGIRVALDNKPDLIVSGLYFSGIDGYSILKVLGENEITAGIPIVIIGGKQDLPDFRRAMELGAEDYLPAPYMIKEVLEVVCVRLRKAAYRGSFITHPPGLNRKGKGKERLIAAFEEHDDIKVYPPGELVVKEGSHARYLYRVKKGYVQLTKRHPYGRDFIIAQLGEGEIFGVSTVLDEENFHYSARVDGVELHLALLPAEELRKLVATDHDVTERLIQLLADRTVVLGDRLVTQAYDTVRRRTAAVLCDLNDRYAPEPVNLSREEIAQMVGTTKESISRSLTAFRKMGLIEVQGRIIHILDVQGLENIEV